MTNKKDLQKALDNLWERYGNTLSMLDDALGRLEKKPKEVIKEVEIIKEIEVIKEVPVEVVKEVEVIKEVKTQGSPEKLKGLQNTIQKLKEEIREKDKSISQYEQIMLELDKEFKNQTATYLASTNLNREL